MQVQQPLLAQPYAPQQPALFPQHLLQQNQSPMYQTLNWGSPRLFPMYQQPQQMNFPMIHQIPAQYIQQQVPIQTIPQAMF